LRNNRRSIALGKSSVGFYLYFFVRWQFQKKHTCKKKWDVKHNVALVAKIVERFGCVLSLSKLIAGCQLWPLEQFFCAPPKPTQRKAG
jgi:hypothetical protein